jgi:hypothetical protein
VRRRGLAFSRERVTITEAIGILGVPELTIRDLAQRGELSGAKIGRRLTFDLGRLRDYLRNMETEAWQSARHRRVVSGEAPHFGTAFRPGALTLAFVRTTAPTVERGCRCRHVPKGPVRDEKRETLDGWGRTKVR